MLAEGFEAVSLHAAFTLGRPRSFRGLERRLQSTRSAFERLYASTGPSRKALRVLSTRLRGSAALLTPSSAPRAGSRLRTAVRPLLSRLAGRRAHLLPVALCNCTLRPSRVEAGAFFTAHRGC